MVLIRSSVDSPKSKERYFERAEIEMMNVKVNDTPITAYSRKTTKPKSETERLSKRILVLENTLSSIEKECDRILRKRVSFESEKELRKHYFDMREVIKEQVAHARKVLR